MKQVFVTTLYITSHYTEIGVHKEGTTATLNSSAFITIICFYVTRSSCLPHVLSNITWELSDFINFNNSHVQPFALAIINIFIIELTG